LARALPTLRRVRRGKVATRFERHRPLPDPVP